MATRTSIVRGHMDNMGRPCPRRRAVQERSRIRSSAPISRRRRQFSRVVMRQSNPKESVASPSHASPAAVTLAALLFQNTSLVVSFVGLLGTVLAAALQARAAREQKRMEAIHAEKEKQDQVRKEAEQRVAARRDPLLLAAVDLEERLVAVCARNLLREGVDSAAPPHLPEYQRSARHLWRDVHGSPIHWRILTLPRPGTHAHHTTLSLHALRPRCLFGLCSGAT